ncbi:MAG: hypothetical protein IT443_00480 [Phycisphaeraceae bacterium]|nr:hypothetical protein [Phycisphaeraceae bacterium]
MSGINFNPGRTTTLMSSDLFLSSLRRTQAAMLKVQTELNTFKKVNVPSDDAGAVSPILRLKNQLQVRAQNESSLNQADAMLHIIGDTLSQMSNVQIQRAYQLALGEDGFSADNTAKAVEVDQILQSILASANQKYQGVGLFSGNKNGQTPAFVETASGGIRYLGSRQNLKVDVGLDSPLDLNSNGVEIFGALSARVTGSVDLDPQTTLDTRLDDLRGALGQGIRRGSFTVTVNGVDTEVNLSGADTLGDVVTLMNNALGAAGTLAVSGSGLSLTVNAGQTVAISDIGQRNTAADLGLEVAATAGPTVLPATDLNPKLTKLSTLASLGVSIDWTSGLHITQGQTLKVVDFSSAVTIEDMMTAVESSDLGIRLEINESGTGLNLVSDVSGLDFSIGENGGTTATDLGLRSFGLNTRLADFRHGQGVETLAGQDDFEIKLADGSSFRVSISGAATVGDALTAIQTAATTAGLTWGTDVNVSLATTGNGLVVTDGTAGTGTFEVISVNGSYAAEDLGIKATGSGGVINGSDQATVRVESVFTHLIALRDALERGDDDRGITIAAERLKDDQDAIIHANGMMGVRRKQISDYVTRSEDMKLVEKNFLSQLQDADLAEAASRYGQLTTQYEASLKVGGAIQQLSLLDFLQ